MFYIFFICNFSIRFIFKAVVSWKRLSEASGYEVYRRTGRKGRYVRIASVKTAKIRTAKGAKSAGTVRYIDRKAGKGPVCSGSTFLFSFQKRAAMKYTEERAEKAGMSRSQAAGSTSPCMERSPTDSDLHPIPKLR